MTLFAAVGLRRISLGGACWVNSMLPNTCAMSAEPYIIPSGRLTQRPVNASGVQLQLPRSTFSYFATATWQRFK